MVYSLTIYSAMFNVSSSCVDYKMYESRQSTEMKSPITPLLITGDVRQMDSPVALSGCSRLTGENVIRNGNLE